MDIVVALLLTLPTQTPAEAAPAFSIGFGPVVQTVGGVGAFGLIAWLVKRVFTHTIPRLAGDFRDSMKSQSDTFKEEMQLQRELFERETIRQREDFREELRQQRTDFKEEISREREFFGEQFERLSRAVESLERTLRDSGEVN